MSTNKERDTARERERRKTNPAYRARYNKLRLDYYHRSNMINLTDTQLLEIRNKVFGPCTVVGECFSIEELRVDIADYVAGQRKYSAHVRLSSTNLVTRTRLREWFKLRVDVELITVERDSEARHPDGPTSEQAAKEKVERLLFKRRLAANIKAFMARLAP